jgi:hypothetical protein
VKAETIEWQIATKYITFERVVKIARKIETDTGTEVTIKDTGRILGSVYHDLITEDLWTVLKKFRNPTIDFRALKKEVDEMTKHHFQTLLLGDVA